MSERFAKLSSVFVLLSTTALGYFVSRQIAPIALIFIFPIANFVFNLLTVKVLETHFFLVTSIVIALAIYPFAPAISAAISGLFAGYVGFFLCVRWMKELKLRKAVRQARHD